MNKHNQSVSFLFLINLKRKKRKVKIVIEDKVFVFAATTIGRCWSEYDCDWLLKLLIICQSNYILLINSLGHRKIISFVFYRQETFSSRIDLTKRLQENADARKSRYKEQQQQRLRESSLILRKRGRSHSSSNGWQLLFYSILVRFFLLFLFLLHCDNSDVFSIRGKECCGSLSLQWNRIIKNRGRRKTQEKNYRKLI